MRSAVILGTLGLLVACSTPHAVAVRCDAKLRPINVATNAAGHPVASRDSRTPEQLP